MRTVLLQSSLNPITDFQCGLLDSQQCRELGVSRRTIRTLLDRGQWRSLARGVYDTQPTTLPERSWLQRHQRAAWAALLAFGPDAVAVGTSALALLEVQGLPSRIAPEVALPGGRSATGRGGLRLRQFDAGMVCVPAKGRLVASPEWALAQAVPELDRDHAIALMDSAQHLGLLDAAGLGLAHDLARQRRGVGRTHPWWSCSDPRAESALETFGRLDCVDGGVPPDDLQVLVISASGLILGRGDLGWLQRNGRWLIGEMDGREPHELPEALLYDRYRQNQFLIEGSADVLRFTYRDLRPRGTIARAVLRALAV